MQLFMEAVSRRYRSISIWCGAVLSAVLGLQAVSGFAAPPASSEPDPIDFRNEIRPILSDRCYACHGPDASNRKADLRLDTREGATALLDGAGESALHVVKPGDPAHSELFRRIIEEDPDERMPPPKSKLELSDSEIELIRRWIEQGASWSGHWSFEPVQVPPIPRVTLDSWPRQPLDRFVLARLERAGLDPSPEASRERLLRRVSFDLVGLPPTPDEVLEFLADDAPGAYERVVDRLLASARFGERMAVAWLDLARYSDTFGYQVDRDRDVWAWRDWVIDAFNSNLPYDQFVTWQLAGDMLPEATDEQILATTFNRLHSQKVEGGSTPEEFRVEYVADRTHTVSTAFLGLTFECARCHDHKYDPLTQKEYYKLYAFFNNIDEAGLYSYFTSSTPTPTLVLADSETKQSVTAIESRIREAESSLAERRAALRESVEFHEWLRDGRSGEAVIPGRLGHFTFDEVIDGKLANSDDDQTPASTSEANRIVPGKRGNALRLTGDDAVSFKIGNFSRNQPFSLALWVNTPDVKERAVVLHRSRAWTDSASRGYQLLLEDGALSMSLIHFWPGNAIRIRTVDPVPVRQWVHVAVTYDGSSRADGLRIFVDGQRADTIAVRDNLYKNITGSGGDHITIGERFRDRGFAGGLVDELEVYERRLTPLEVAQIHDQSSLNAAMKTPASGLSDRQKAALFDYYASAIDSDLSARRQALLELRKERSGKVDGLREVMVMRDLDDSRRRRTHLLLRGAYNAPGEPVEPGTPAVLPPFPEDAPRNRLGLARWLTDPKHPLTARVAVNRFWQMCFGQGLVRTPEDFGSQGQLPTHPELLDWLAGDFVGSGWDIKRMMKMLVMSSTYRQSSNLSPELRRRDPGNLLYARAPRYRLPAEMIRDNALAASGLLLDRTGGPPARPYEVAVSFKPVGRDKGAGLYRRSLYTYWKRTGPAPVMMALDAAKRDVCVVKRERTATPLQALVLLNDPQMAEAARVLGERLTARFGDDIDGLIAEMFIALTGRRADPSETHVMRRLYDEQLAHFAAHPEAAVKFRETGDAAPNTAVPADRAAAAGVLAGALLNFDGCVIKR